VFKTFLFALLVIVLAPSTAAAQKLHIDVQGVAQPTPVAVVPFGWQGIAPVSPLDVAAVIKGDLRRSGRFAPTDENDMLQKPTDGADVDFDDWTILGVEAVVVGQIIQSGEDAYTLQFQLFDSFTRKQLVGYRMPASRATLRSAAHRVADMIYEKLTGIKGVFGTQVAYVTAEQRGKGRLYSLIVSDQDGENDHKIMESKDPIMSPAWSPDSRQLAYVSFEGSKSSIFVETLRSGNRFQVSSKPGVNSAPSF